MCKYCSPETSVFDPVYISDKEEPCKWCDKDKCDNYEDSCYGIGYTVVPLNYCPYCGTALATKLKANYKQGND